MKSLLPSRILIRLSAILWLIPHLPVTKFLTVLQSAAIEQIISANPMANATAVLCGLELLPDPGTKISPSKVESKQRVVQRAVSKALDRTLQPLTQGGRLEGGEGSLNRLSEKKFFVLLWRSTMLEDSILICINPSA